MLPVSSPTINQHQHILETIVLLRKGWSVDEKQISLNLITGVMCYYTIKLLFCTATSLIEFSEDPLLMQKLFYCVHRVLRKV